MNSGVLSLRLLLPVKGVALITGEIQPSSNGDPCRRANSSSSYSAITQKRIKLPEDRAFSFYGNRVNHKQQLRSMISLSIP